VLKLGSSIIGSRAYGLKVRCSVSLHAEWLRTGSQGSEVFGWCRAPKNTRSRIFYPTPEVQLDNFFIAFLS